MHLKDYVNSGTYHWNHIESEKEYFINGEAIAITWDIRDLRDAFDNIRNEENGEHSHLPEDFLEKEDYLEILLNLRRNHNCEIGITWDLINAEIEYAIEKAIIKKNREQDVLELCLCESRFLVLKPDQKYIFRVDPSCKSCLALKEAGKPVKDSMK